MSHLEVRRRRKRHWSDPVAAVWVSSILVSLGWQAAAVAAVPSLAVCRTDALRYCATIDRSGAPERACLRQHATDLSRHCRIALQGERSLGATGDRRGTAR